MNFLFDNASIWIDLECAILYESWIEGVVIKWDNVGLLRCVPIAGEVGSTDGANYLKTWKRF